MELCYLLDYFTNCNNLAEQYPEKIKELRELWRQEAEKYKVLPLLGGMRFHFGMVPQMRVKSRFTFYDDVQNIASQIIAPIHNHSYTISAELEIPWDGAEGVIVAEADHLGGFSLFVQDGKLMHTYSMMGILVYHQESDSLLPTGKVNVRLEFAADEPKPATGGNVTLYVNDEPAGGGRIDHTIPFRFSGYARMDIGRDSGPLVDRSYASKSPFPFHGKP